MSDLNNNTNKSIVFDLVVILMSLSESQDDDLKWYICRQLYNKGLCKWEIIFCRDFLTIDNDGQISSLSAFGIITYLMVCICSWAVSVFAFVMFSPNDLLLACVVGFIFCIIVAYLLKKFIIPAIGSYIKNHCDRIDNT